MDTLRIGKISAVNYQQGTARVLYTDRDKAVTAELPLLAGEGSMPNVDDLVLVCHLPNGAAAGVILGRFWNDNRRPIEGAAGLYRRDLDDGVYIRYEKGGKLQIVCEKGVEIKGDVEIDGKLTATEDITGSNISLETHKHTDSEGGSTSAPN